MSLNRYAKKRDENEPQIVAALRKIGAECHKIDRPADLIVGFAGQTLLVEVKMPKGKLNKSQRDFWRDFRGAGFVTSDPEHAVQALMDEVRRIRDEKGRDGEGRRQPAGSYRGFGG